MLMKTQSLSHLWSRVPLGPPDAVLGITEAFKADSDPGKINLGVGAYRDDSGNPYILGCVKKAEQRLLASNSDHEYAGIDGFGEFNSATLKLAYGENSRILKENRIAVAQSISGTGALRLGGEFIKRFYDPSERHKIYLPAPTWQNHFGIFRDSGIEIATYRYYHPESRGLNFDGLLQDMKNAPSGSIFLFHACAHNPTGVDPTAEQWADMCDVAVDKKFLCFFDMAYQGFASGCPDRDAAAVRMFAERGMPIVLAQSYAKNFGLYGERVGALSIITNSREEKEHVESQLKLIIRPMYSNPPIHGAKIVATVLNSTELKKEWLREVKAMADRIIGMRKALKTNLVSLGSPMNWNHITNQIGMFCYTGLTESQVESITKDHHVYLTKDGRISIAGINPSNVGRLSGAIHAVTSGKRSKI